MLYKLNCYYIGLYFIYKDSNSKLHLKCVRFTHYIAYFVFLTCSVFVPSSGEDEVVEVCPN